MQKRKVDSAILIVLIAGVFWSFGALVVRFIEDARSVPWQYLFFRGSTIFILINIYLFIKEGKSFTENYKKIGASGIIGGISLGVAMMCFIWSITHTTAAVTLLMLAAMPFMTAILGYIFLKEKVSIITFTSIVIAAIVIVIISRGIPSKPIIPRIKKAAIKFGTTPMKESTIFLNRTKNIKNIPSITIPKVSICDLNKLCNKLLNKMRTPANLYSSFSKPNFVFNSELIFLIKSFLLKFSNESLILTLILASSFSTDI